MKLPHLCAAAAVLTLAAGSADATVVTNGVVAGTSTQACCGGTQTVNSNPFTVYRNFSWLVGSLLPVSGGGVTFANGVAVAASFGGQLVSAASTTSLLQHVTNDTGGAVRVDFSSLLLAGGFGMFAASPGDCVNTAANCPANPFHALSPSGTSHTGFTIGVRVNNIPIYSLSASLMLVNGVLTPDVSQVTFLNGFTARQVNVATGLGRGVSQQFYSWVDTPFELSLGNLNPGQSLDMTYVLTTFSDVSVNADSEGGQAQIAFSAFGDPTGGGHVINSIAINIDEIQQPLIVLTALAGPVPEPSIWALLLAGFGLTGAALRRRRPAGA